MQSEHAHPASQAAHQKQQALPVSGHIGKIPLSSFARHERILSEKYPWPSMILFFLYLTVSAAFATIIHGYIYPDNRKISNPNCCKPDKLQQFFCTLFTKSPFIKTEKRTEKWQTEHEPTAMNFI